MDTFVPPIAPSYDGAGIQEAPRVLSVSFGDGYKQEAPDGLNTNTATATYSWSYLTASQKDQILLFYKAQIGKTFLWDAPGDTIGTGKWRFTSNGIKHSPVGYNWFSVSINIERSFEI